MLLYHLTCINFSIPALLHHKSLTKTSSPITTTLSETLFFKKRAIHCDNFKWGASSSLLFSLTPIKYFWYRKINGFTEPDDVSNLFPLLTPLWFMEEIWIQFLGTMPGIWLSRMRFCTRYTRSSKTTEWNSFFLLIKRSR